MKKTTFTLLCVTILLAASFSIASANKPARVDANGMEIARQKSGCTTIQSGLLLSSTGQTLTTGFDQWGYNYQARTFNGYYDNFSRPAVPVTEGDSLNMKWNDAWLSNVDCDGDGKLDRHYGYASYIGSGAWLTNKMSGVVDGMTWTYFVKIVAKPSADFDCTAGGGYEVWGEFCVIQEVNGGHPSLNEAYGGNGVVTLMQPAGLGAWQP
ncbi:MAG: hypothetical protein ROW39_05185 [Anaerolineaceae bacterium]|jgi:hypothetical protein